MKNITEKIFDRFENEGLHSFTMLLESLMFRIRRAKYKLFMGWDIAGIIGPANIRGAKHIRLGKNFRCRNNLWMDALTKYNDQRFTPSIIIGDNFSASDYFHIAATNKIIIGNNVLVGSKVLITDHVHGVYSGEMQSGPHEYPAMRLLTADKSVIIGDNVFIGDNVCIMPGVTIGFGVIIASNAVVNTNIPAVCMAAGAPARIIRIYNENEKKWKAVGKNVQSD